MFVLLKQVDHIVKTLEDEGFSREANAVAWLLKAYEHEMCNREIVIQIANEIIKMAEAERPKVAIIAKMNKLIESAKSKLR